MHVGHLTWLLFLSHRSAPASRWTMEVQGSTRRVFFPVPFQGRRAFQRLLGHGSLSTLLPYEPGLDSIPRVRKEESPVYLRGFRFTSDCLGQREDCSNPTFPMIRH